MKTAAKIDVQFSNETPSIGVLRSFFEDVGWQSSDAFIDEAVLFRPHSLLTTIWVRLNQDGNAIGMARVFLPPKTPNNAPAFIGDVIINTLSQRQGFGLYLINAIESYCKNQGVQLLVIETNPSSEGFWRSIGFIPRESMEGLLFRNTS